MQINETRINHRDRKKQRVRVRGTQITHAKIIKTVAEYLQRVTKNRTDAESIVIYRGLATAAENAASEIEGRPSSDSYPAITQEGKTE